MSEETASVSQQQQPNGERVTALLARIDALRADTDARFAALAADVRCLEESRDEQAGRLGVLDAGLAAVRAEQARQGVELAGVRADVGSLRAHVTRAAAGSGGVVTIVCVLIEAARAAGWLR